MKQSGTETTTAHNSAPCPEDPTTRVFAFKHSLTGSPLKKGIEKEHNLSAKLKI